MLPKYHVTMNRIGRIYSANSGIINGGNPIPFCGAHQVSATIAIKAVNIVRFISTTAIRLNMPT